MHPRLRRHARLRLQTLNDRPERPGRPLASSGATVGATARATFSFARRGSALSTSGILPRDYPPWACFLERMCYAGVYGLHLERMTRGDTRNLADRTLRYQPTFGRADSRQRTACSKPGRRRRPGHRSRQGWPRYAGEVLDRVAAISDALMPGQTSSATYFDAFDGHTELSCSIASTCSTRSPATSCISRNRAPKWARMCQTCTARWHTR